MIHYTTKNLSFLKVSHLLKAKGVKNNAFFLQLYDKTLLNVDAKDEVNLTEDQKQRILIECTRNPWYYVRECVNIAASGVVPFELHLGNLAFLWAAFYNFSTFMVLSRQRGKTTAAAVAISWIMYFGGRNTEMMLYAQTNKNLINNIGRIRSVRQNLPTYLQLNDTKKDRDGAEMITFNSLGNKILKQAPKRSEEGADSVGRGFSTPIQWYDEFAFIPHIKTQYQASVLAYNKVARRASEFGLPHSIMITTTAAFLNNQSGIYAYQFFQDCLSFDESFYDMSRDDISTLMMHEAKRDFIRIEYPYWDLSTEDGYFDEQCKALNYEQDAIDREVLNKWKAVSTSHPLGQDAIKRLDDNSKKPNVIVVINDLYRLKLYKDPNKLDWSVPYLIGGDCGNNIGNDYSALVVVDPRDYSVVATLRSNCYSTMLYGNMIVSLMKEFFYNSILVLERNLNGATIIDKIVEVDFNLSSRIYCNRNNAISGKLGIDTNQKSRERIYNQVLKIAVDDSYDRIFDETIINEIKGLIRTRSGRIDHQSGGHDDTLISWLFTRLVLIYGDNLERYINPLIIGSLYDIRGVDEKEKEGNAKKRIEILDRVKREETKSMRRLYGNSNNLLDDPDGNVMSIREQHDFIRNDGRVSNKNSIDDTFDRAYGSLIDRYQPQSIQEDEITAAVKHKFEISGKLKTVDIDSMEIDDSNESEIQYTKNPKDIEYSSQKVIENDTQLQRSIMAKNNESLNNDLSWFMSNL